MDEHSPAEDPGPPRKTNLVLGTLLVGFVALAAAFALNLWGRQAPLDAIPLVDPALLDTATNRRSYADLVRAKEDLSDFDCYTCHEKNKAPTLRYDEHQNLLIPTEHSDIVMGHGEHGRNNNCFNCHNETNLKLLQTRDGRALQFDDSPQLCGSCHGPTYDDWEAGAHGRISGFWNRRLGAIKRQDCVNCHNPHSPAFQGRQPAPGPHPLHGPMVKPTAESGH